MDKNRRYMVSCDFSGFDGTISADVKNAIEVPMVTELYKALRPKFV
jgi:hypothetical protein